MNYGGGSAKRGPRPSLSVWDAISITLGIVIGAGIYESPALVASNASSAGEMLLVWLAGGVLSLVGGLCFAELATTYPHAGGNYEYLRRAFGSGTAFLFVWARMTVIQTGSMALLGFVFGDYASQVVNLGRFSSSIYALAVIVLFTAINLAGVRLGKNTQNLLTTATVLGISFLIISGLFLSPAAGTAANHVSAGKGSLGLMLIFVLLAYGGWNEAAFISAEVKGRKGIAMAFLLSIGAVTAIYILVNAAMLRGLGLVGMAGSKAVAADLMRAALGENGARLLSLLVVVSVLGSLNVTIMTGARAMYALGEDFSILGFLGGWGHRVNTPVNALLGQAVIAALLVGFGAIQRAGFATMVGYTAPVFWFFFFLTAVSLMLLRRREPEISRPFRVPLYPLVPLAFCAVAAYLVYASLAYAGTGSLVGAAVLVAGIPVLLVARRKQQRSAPATAVPRRAI